MADGVKYEVTVEYTLSGNLLQKLPAAGSAIDGFENTLGRSRKSAAGLGGDLDKASGAASDMGRAFMRAGEGIAGAFTGAVEKAGSMAKTFAMVAGGAALGGVVYGVTTLNNEIEKTKIGLADILTANGVSSNLNEGLGMASGLMKEIRKDAAALPGETRDLAQIFKLAAIPGLQSGATPERVEKLSANAMAFGMGVANLDSGTVARELSMLLSGRAGSHNILGLQLAGLGGDKAQAFNKMSGAERMKTLEGEFGKHAGSIELFGKSFEGQKSTFFDNIKLLTANATSPLFDHITHSLLMANTWIEKNQSKLSIFTGRLGDGLAAAWDRGTQIFAEWAPAIERFAQNTADRIGSAWRAIGPEVSRVATIVRESLMDGKALDRLEGIAKLYATVKIGGMVGGAASPLLSSAWKLAGAGGGFGMGGAGGGAFGAALVEAGTVALPMLAAAALAAGGELSALTDVSSKYHDAAVTNATSLAKASADFGGDLKNGYTSYIEPALQWFGTELAGEAATILGWMHQLATNRADTTKGASRNNSLIDWEYFDPTAPAGGYAKLNPNSDDYHPAGKDYDLSPGVFMKNMNDAVGDIAKKAATKATPPTINIANVSVNVSSNADPNRVARSVGQHLAEMRRHPTVSRSVRNWSGVTG